MVKIIVISALIIFALSHSHSLQHCINHILHQSRNQNFQCQNNEELHFYSTFVLPDGASRCLQGMKQRKGFYVSTVKSFTNFVINEEEVQLGAITRSDIIFNGWKCDIKRQVGMARFKGIKLYISKCKHNQADFEDICIIKGWPLQQLANQDIL